MVLTRFMVMRCTNLRIQSRNAKSKILTSVCTVRYVAGTPRDDKTGDGMSRHCLRANVSCKYETDSEIYCTNYCERARRRSRRFELDRNDRD